MRGMTEETFHEGETVKVIFDGSMRCGEIGTVTELRPGTAYGVIVRHPDEQERAWKPAELSHWPSVMADRP